MSKINYTYKCKKKHSRPFNDFPSTLSITFLFFSFLFQNSYDHIFKNIIMWPLTNTILCINVWKGGRAWGWYCDIIAYPPVDKDTELPHENASIIYSKIQTQELQTHKSLYTCTQQNC